MAPCLFLSFPVGLTPGPIIWSLGLPPPSHSAFYLLQGSLGLFFPFAFGLFTPLAAAHGVFVGSPDLIVSFDSFLFSGPRFLSGLANADPPIGFMVIDVFCSHLLLL